MSSLSPAAEDDDMDTIANELGRSPSPVLNQPNLFFLEPSYTDEELSVSGTSAIQHTDVDVSEPNTAVSTEFGNLLKVMLRREGSSCMPEDRPVRQGSLESFTVPKGLFGSAVLPHVSSFG